MKARPTTKADETPEFVEFWEQVWKPVMNKNDGRGSARDEFFRHVQNGADPRDIVDGARWFVRQGGNGEFKLHAQTWLNRRAYEDGAEQERTYQQRLQEKQSNVVSIKPKSALPENHFSRRWERGEFG